MKVLRPNGKSAGARLAAGHTAFCTDSKAAAYRPPAQLTGSLSLACAGQATWFRLGPERQVKSLPPPLAGLVMITLGLQGHLSPTCPPTLASQEGALYEQQAPTAAPGKPALSAPPGPELPHFCTHKSSNLCLLPSGDPGCPRTCVPQAWFITPTTGNCVRAIAKGLGLGRRGAS